MLSGRLFCKVVFTLCFAVSSNFLASSLFAQISAQFQDLPPQSNQEIQSTLEKLVLDVSGRDAEFENEVRDGGVVDFLLNTEMREDAYELFTLGVERLQDARSRISRQREEFIRSHSEDIAIADAQRTESWWHKVKHKIALGLNAVRGHFEQDTRLTTTTRSVDEQLRDLTSKNEFQFEYPKGRVEINGVKTDDGRGFVFFIRVILKNNLSLCFAEESSKIRELDGFKVWVSKQYHDSTANDGAGRDVLLIETRNGAITDLKSYKRPEHVLTGKFWFRYWYSIKTKNRFRGAVIGATAVLAAEVAYMAAFDKTAQWLYGGEINWAPYVPKIIFGMGIGSFTPLYNNWVKLGAKRTNSTLAKFRSVFKAYLVSFAFGYAMILTQNPGATISSVSPWTLAGMASFAFIASNKFLTGWWRDELNERINTLEAIREISSKTRDRVSQFTRYFSGFVCYLDFRLQASLVTLGLIMQDQYGVHEATPFVLTRLLFFPVIWLTMHSNYIYFKNRAEQESRLSETDLGMSLIDTNKHLSELKAEADRLLQRKQKFEGLLGRMLSSTGNWFQKFNEWVKSKPVQRSLTYREKQQVIEKLQIKTNHFSVEADSAEWHALRFLLTGSRHPDDFSRISYDMASLMESGHPDLDFSEIARLLDLEAKRGVEVKGHSLLTRMKDLEMIVNMAAVHAGALSWDQVKNGEGISFSEKFKSSLEAKIHAVWETVHEVSSLPLSSLEDEDFVKAFDSILSSSVGLNYSHFLQSSLRSFETSVVKGCASGFAN